MVVGASTDEAVGISLHSLCQGSGVFYNLLLVCLKTGLGRLMEAHRLGGNDVHQRPSLDSRERLRIDFLGELLFAQNESAPRPSPRLVRGGGYKIGMFDR